MPQNAIFAPLSATIPATSHLGLLGFKLENDENMSKDFITPTKDSLYFRKNIVSSGHAVSKKV